MKKIFIIVALLHLGCTRSDRQADTPTSGAITIAVDEALQPLIAAEIQTFEGLYRSAHIKARYVSEAEAIRLLLADSVRLAITTRTLTPVEKHQILLQKISPHELKVAREAVAIIGNRMNNDTLWDDAKLKHVLSGATGQTIVFDNNQSGIARFVRDSLLRSDVLPPNARAVASNAAVVEYIKVNKGAIGLIGSSWISDTDDTVANRFRDSINVIALQSGSDYYRPYQAYIAQNVYPLVRDIVIISREPRSGLGTGFMSFVAGDKGQRIVLKAGLVPATMPVRIVEIRDH